MSFGRTYSGTPRYNFKFGFHSERVEEMYEEDLCDDIFYLSFNYATKIALIPRIEEWPPTYPENDSTKQEVRKEVFFHSRYVITPDNLRIGEIELLNSDYLVKQLQIEKMDIQTVVFFVSDKKFELYCLEANKLWDKIESWGKSNLFEDLKEQFEIAQFIEEQIINSPYLTDSELTIIGRMRDAEGNVVPDPQYQY